MKKSRKELDLQAWFLEGETRVRNRNLGVISTQIVSMRNGRRKCKLMLKIALL